MSLRFVAPAKAGATCPPLSYTLTTSALAARLRVTASVPLVPDTPRAITVDAENVMAPLTAAVARSATGIMRVEPLRWVIGDPASGGMAVADVSRRRESGAQWSTSASAWLARPAAEGWEPALVLRLQATRGDLAPYFIGTHVVVP